MKLTLKTRVALSLCFGLLLHGLVDGAPSSGTAALPCLATETSP